MSIREIALYCLVLSYVGMRIFLPDRVFQRFGEFKVRAAQVLFLGVVVSAFYFTG